MHCLAFVSRLNPGCAGGDAAFEHDLAGLLLALNGLLFDRLAAWKPEAVDRRRPLFEKRFVCGVSFFGLARGLEIGFDALNLFLKGGDLGLVFSAVRALQIAVFVAVWRIQRVERISLRLPLKRETL